MKKSFVFGSCLLAALSAQAADVQMYGAMDTGLTYTRQSSDKDTLAMTSGNYAGPRFGIKGQEQVGEDLFVKYILEAGFTSDSGSSGAQGKLFNRESQLSLNGSWGTLGFGRVGAFSSGSSSLSWYWDMEPFETGYVDAGIQATQINAWRLNSNVVYYVSPVVQGVKFGAQYGLTGSADEEKANWSDNDQWMNLALRWDGNNAKVVLGFETERYGLADDNRPRRDRFYNVKLAGAWTVPATSLTLYAGTSWYKNSNTFSDAVSDQAKFDGENTGKRLDGYSFHVGTKYTVGSWDLLGLVQYLDGRNKGTTQKDNDYQRWVASIGGHYHLSNRTMLYLVTSVAHGNGVMKIEKDGEDVTDGNRWVSHIGMTHFF